VASDAIKERIYRQANGVDELTDLPEQWLNAMLLPFEMTPGKENRARAQVQFAPFKFMLAPKLTPF